MICQQWRRIIRAVRGNWALGLRREEEARDGLDFDFDFANITYIPFEEKVLDEVRLDDLRKGRGGDGMGWDERAAGWGSLDD